MRILFLLLVLANLGYFTWQWQQQDNQIPPPSGPIAAAPDSNTLKLLSELDSPDAADNTAEPRSDALQETTPPPENP
jgi:hypothetical protein